MHLMYSLVKVRNRPRRSRSATGPEMGWLYDRRRLGDALAIDSLGGKLGRNSHGSPGGAPAPNQASRERGVVQVAHLGEARDRRRNFFLLVAPACQLLAQLGSRVCPGSQEPDPCI